MKLIRIAKLVFLLKMYSQPDGYAFDLRLPDYES